ncbi:hypothetical protein ACS49_03400 [Bacillus cereus]|nr:hypothetical protein ACS49_03400 [Bacillus cereus]
MTQGNLVKWHKKVGDALQPGESIAEVETDKASMDFEFQEEGFLAKILVPDGTQDIPVGKPVAVYVEDSGDVAALRISPLQTPVMQVLQPQASQPRKKPLLLRRNQRKRQRRHQRNPSQPKSHLLLHPAESLPRH